VGGSNTPTHFSSGASILAKIRFTTNVRINRSCPERLMPVESEILVLDPFSRQRFIKSFGRFQSQGLSLGVAEIACLGIVNTQVLFGGEKRFLLKTLNYIQKTIFRGVGENNPMRQ
jgi:hypothetical protein